MLTGRCPFAGHTVDVLMAHRRQEPPSVRHFNPNVPPEIELLIHQMLAKNPSSRLQSMSQVVAELTLAERSASGVEPPPERVPRFARGSAPPDLPSSMRMERFAPTVGSTTSRKPDYDPRARGPSILGKVMVMLTVIALLASVAATGYYAYITGWF
jgi:serine/threonine protein kinase